MSPHTITRSTSSNGRTVRSLSSPQPFVTAATAAAAASKNSKAKNNSVSYCLPTRKTKRQSLPPITKSNSTSNLATVSTSTSTSTTAAVSQKSQSQQPQPLKVWLMSLLKISSTHRTAPTIKVLPASTSTSAPAPASTAAVVVKPKLKPIVRETQQPRVIAFTKLIESHREFFKGCPEIDCYLISMAFLYLQRATPTIPVESMNTEMLFFALYLAWESEEDSTVGIEGIIHYIIGPYPSSRGKDKVTRKYEIMEWKRKLNVFHTGKDKLWKALDYNTYADQPTISKTIQLFPADNEIFTRARKPEELRKYF